MIVVWDLYVTNQEPSTSETPEDTGGAI
jgi:hypothetical protein